MEVWRLAVVFSVTHVLDVTATREVTVMSDRAWIQTAPGQFIPTQQYGYETRLVLLATGCRDR